MVQRGYARCLEDIKTPGYYVVTPPDTTTNLHFPLTSLQGILEVLDRDGGVLQRITLTVPSIIIQRFFASYSQSWSSWYKFTGEKVTS